MESLLSLVFGPLKAVARKSLWPYRRVTGHLRSVPDFIVIGAQKSGTSSLFHRDHSLVHCKTGEASPLCLFHPLAPGRIRALVPDVRLVAILRNPTERAISQYFHARGLGREPLPLKEALQQEDERLKQTVRGSVDRQESFIHHSYKSRGLYKEQLERYLIHFPRNQLLVMSSEEFFHQPATSLAAIFEFIGVDAGFAVQDVGSRNVSTNKTEVDPWTYQYLSEYFAPHNEELYRLVGKRFDW